MKSFLEILEQRTNERIEEVEIKLEGVRLHLEYQIVDLRDEIALFEMEMRPFPPRSRSVSKPKKSLEPENTFEHWKFARAGRGGIHLGFEITYDKTGKVTGWFRRCL